MASITEEKNGRRVVQFVARDGKRRSIRLGVVTKRVAETYRIHVELVLSAQLSGHALDDKTARWLGSLDPKMTDKLASVGLIPKREDATLKAFIDNYVDGRSDIKPQTVIRLRQAGQKLVECFGAERNLRDFTLGDADRFRTWLIGKGLAENTVRRLCGRAKQFFRAAMRRKLIGENPFADLVARVKGNPSRFFYGTREMAVKALDACPDAQWRLLFALARFGGLRTPSESLALRWGDVDWENNRIRVTSPKTEHIEGKESRLIPLFPELRPHLEAVWDEAEPGTEYVITRYRGAGVNLRTQLDRIIRRAKITPWEKPWQNCRSTRETELMESYPAHVVCAWIGNSESVARRHYLQVTDEHFERAARGAANSGAVGSQQSAETRRTESQPEQREPDICSAFPAISSRCKSFQNNEIPLRSRPEKTGKFNTARALRQTWAGSFRGKSGPSRAVMCLLICP